MNFLIIFKNFFRRLHWGLNIIALILITISIFFVYSASHVNLESAAMFYKKQIIWAVVGWFCCLIFSAVDYHKIIKISWFLYTISILLLVIVLIAGRKVYGATRWLMIMGIQVQPSEIAKLAVLLVVTRMFANTSDEDNAWKPFFCGLGAMILPMLLIMKQPDLGTAMVIFPSILALMFVGGAPIRGIFGIVISGITAIILILIVLFIPIKTGMSPERQEKWYHYTGLSKYQRDRIMVFFDANVDPLGAGWNKLQSEIAVGSGGIWGKGFKQGTQNILGYLPKSVAPTDFIYSVIAEEMGFAGSLLLIILFASLIFIIGWIGMSASDRTGLILCTGIMALLFVHIFVNIAMAIGLMPITGLPLPLLSYGGSFMIVVMSMLGIVQSVYIRNRENEIYEEEVPGLVGISIGGRM